MTLLRRGGFGLLGIILSMLGACGSAGGLSGSSPRVLAPALETEPVRTSGDAADDVAIWVHRSDPARSRIIATDKRRGMVVFDLDGAIVQEVESEGVNNVDIVRGFPVGDRAVDLAVGSARSGNSIAIYRVDDATGLLGDVAARVITVDGGSVYGLCAGRGFASGAAYVYVSTNDDYIHQFRLFERDGRVDAERVRRFGVGGHAEGMVVDAARNALFVAEEDVGIWRYEAEPAWILRGKAERHPELSSSEAGKRTLIAKVGEDDLAADIEGLAIYPNGDGGYLLAASQGNSVFAVFDRAPPHAHVVSFRIGASGSIDKVSGTDGIEATAVALGARFPRGVLVVQDDENAGGNQNFKVVDWREIEAALGARREGSGDRR